MRGIPFFFREWADWRRFSRTPPSLRQIVFYAEDTASFGYYEGLIRCLTETHDKPVAYVTSDPEDPILRSENLNIRAFYIRHLLAFFVLNLKARFLVMTMPDLNRFHVKRSRHGLDHVYLFHNIGSSFPVLRHAALFDYDTIFCSGPHHEEEIRHQEQLYDLPAKRLVKFGYYRLEKMYQQYRQYVRSHQPGPADRRRVVIGPSWGPDSILNRCGADLIEVLLGAGFEVIMRPHGMTYRKDPRLIKDLLKRFGSHDHFVHDPDMGFLETLYESDVLISDWSGLAYEYAFATERPVLFVDLSQKIVNAKFNAIGIEPVDPVLRHELGTVLGLDELSRAPQAVEDLIARREEFVEGIRAARDKYVYNFGSSSEAGAAYFTDA